MTREIGSLAKPSWRVKAFAGRPLEKRDHEEAQRWGQRLEVAGYERLLELLHARAFGEGELAEIDDWSCLYALRLLERAGLDVVYDGEQRRSEMYDHVARACARVRAAWRRAGVRQQVLRQGGGGRAPAGRGAVRVEEFRFVAANTGAQPKVPLTGPYTIVDWSYDEHYGSPGALGGTAAARSEARRAFVVDVAERVIRPNAVGLGRGRCGMASDR